MEKINPSVEGIYLGRRKVKSTNTYVFFVKTKEGKMGVWGKPDLFKLMKKVKLKTKVRISFFYNVYVVTTK